ncbi:hypothetical protein LINGRAHAP2_LOCUS7927 [Linum grandiflorum]
MKMAFQFRLICLQVHTSKSKHFLDIGASPSNEKLASSFSKSVSAKNSQGDFNSGAMRNDRYTQKLDTNCSLKQPYSCTEKL